MGTLSTALLGVASFIGKQFFKVFNLLNDSLAEGTGRLAGAFTDAPVNLAAEAARAGLSVKEFGEALARNSEEIIVLGTENFRKLRNQVIDLEGGFFDMGFRQEQITEMLGREMSIRARLGVVLDDSLEENQDLGKNVVQTAQEVRMLGNDRINAEILYEAGKQTDETISIARARQFGDVGINALSTSVRRLAMRITALSPTFGKEVSQPLINSMLAGAVGLDSAFTDLVTVMPGLVSVFQQGRDEIMRGGGIQESTIDRMMERLTEVSEVEFNRARMLALMTRNQNALNLVNFASEARARKDLLQSINDSGNVGAFNTIESAAKLSGQLELFIDSIKAPFENAATIFAAAFLGTNLEGGGANLGNLISAFADQAEKFLSHIPILNNLLDNEFFDSLREFVDVMFKDLDDDNQPITEEARREARAKLNALITDAISDFGDELAYAFRTGNFGAMMATWWAEFIDDLSIAIYKASGPLKLMAESAGEAFVRQGRYDEAAETRAYGFGTSAGVAAINDATQNQKNFQRRLGFSDEEMKFLNEYVNDSTYRPAERRAAQRFDRFIGSLGDTFGEQFVVANKIMQEYYAEINMIQELANEAGYLNFDGTSDTINEDIENGVAGVWEFLGLLYSRENQQKFDQFKNFQNRIGTIDDYDPVKTNLELVESTDADGKKVTELVKGIRYSKQDDYENIKMNDILANTLRYTPDRIDFLAGTETTNLLNSPEFRDMLRINDGDTEAVTRQEFREFMGINEQGEYTGQGRLDGVLRLLELNAENTEKLRNDYATFLNNLNKDNLLYKP